MKLDCQSIKIREINSIFYLKIEIKIEFSLHIEINSTHSPNDDYVDFFSVVLILLRILLDLQSSIKCFFYIFNSHPRLVNFANSSNYYGCLVASRKTTETEIVKFTK